MFELCVHLDFIPCMIVFTFLTVVLFLYCFILCVFNKLDLATTKKLYLVCDVSSKMRYVYLIKICTGGKPSAGTTSTICLRFLGKHFKSQAHVLNYPDPYKKILQRGQEDWFVILTLQLLESIYEVELWSDYSGQHPSWFCSNITVCDLQTQHFWFFDVNKWIDLPPRSNIYIKVPLSEKKIKKKIFFFMTWFPQRIYQSGISSVIKLNLILSIVSNIMVYTLFFFQIPSLKMKDVFATITSYSFDEKIFFRGFGTAFLTSILHITWIVIYRLYLSKCLKLKLLIIFQTNI